MSTHIMVQAVGLGEGFNGAWRAGRKWPANEPLAVEVLDQEDDPTALSEEYTDDSGNKKTRLVPNPTRIGKATFRLLKEDTRLRILSDKETSTTQSDAALTKARQLASAAQAENSELKVKVSGLEAENQRFRSLLEQNGISADERAPVAAATEGEGGEGEGEPTEEGHPRRRRR